MKTFILQKIIKIISYIAIISLTTMSVLGIGHLIFGVITGQLNANFGIFS